MRTHLAMEALRGRLRESEERLSSILEHAMDAIVTLDKEGRVTLFNRAAERLFRRSAEQIVGHGFAPFASERLRRLLADFAGRDADEQLPLWLSEGHAAVRANGEVFPIEANLSRAQAGVQALYTLILRDVQERQRAEAEQRRLRGLNQYLRQELDSVQGPFDLVGAAQGLSQVMERVRQVAATDATVLITGETGTGKELIARAVHAQSLRRDQVLVTLNCAAIALPALRERGEDIPLLVQHFLRHYAGKYGKQVDRVPESVMASFERYDWPGNVRELQHLIERAVILSAGPELVLDEPLQSAPVFRQSTGTNTLAEVERAHILQVLEQSNWRVSGPDAAAERLGLKPTTLESRMKKLGISRPRT